MSHFRNLPPLLLLCFTLFFAGVTLAAADQNPTETSATGVASPAFDVLTIDKAGPSAAWAKASGDINNDGLPDLLVGGHKPRALTWMEKIRHRLGWALDERGRGELVWYRNPDWDKRRISSQFAIRTDVEIADLDADGRSDIVALTNRGLVIFWHASEEAVEILSPEKYHDVEIADLDGDGDLDIVVRNQSLFGYDNGNIVTLFRHHTAQHDTFQNDTFQHDTFQKNASTAWSAVSLPAPHGEGLAVVDINGDDRPDIVVNGELLLNPGAKAFEQSWHREKYAVDWVWQDTAISTGDIDGDGLLDIVLTPAEQAGQTYRISWFSWRDDTLESREHIVDATVEAVHHFVGVADFNGDGAPDIATAEMNQGDDPDYVTVYLNDGLGATWQKRRIGNHGSHNMRIVDVDADFAPDLFGANWQFEDGDAAYPVTLWRNARWQHSESEKTYWPRIVIDPARPGKALFIDSADIDSDGAIDIVTGGYWYKNPGIPQGNWQRHEIGEPMGNFVLARDFDGDGDTDILGSSYRGKSPPPLYRRALNRLGIWAYAYGDPGHHFALATNNGNGQFSVDAGLPEARGDYLQGAAFYRRASSGDSSSEASLAARGPDQVLLSWHGAGEGVQALSPPARGSDSWRWHQLSAISQDEAISVADIDRDGLDDIVLGTQWLRALPDGSWQPQVLFDAGPGLPDRHRVVDMNNDGRLDIVIGYQAVSRRGVLAWYEQGEDATAYWPEHRIDLPVGPMSLDVADIDSDGDWDIIAGEHNLRWPTEARLLRYENIDGVGGRWRASVLHKGDEHHNGTQLVDIDQDGDLDIISIGWGHRRVILYVNPG